MPEPININHIAFRCRNLAAQEAFYAKHFGFKRCRTFRRGEPGEFFMMMAGNARLEFFPIHDAARPEDKGGEQSIGFRHLAFNVPKLETIQDLLRADGIEFDSLSELGNMWPGFRIAFFKDPEGNIIELMENYKDED
jgi:glyoxylase I family protein